MHLSVLSTFKALVDQNFSPPYRHFPLFFILFLSDFYMALERGHLLAGFPKKVNSCLNCSIFLVGLIPHWLSNEKLLGNATIVLIKRELTG
uniref:Uncharacterized protein n=1 Tax=Rhizophora mucronata TaxID=61149 RepID=A0A2P2QX23_RHIMU